MGKFGNSVEQETENQADQQQEINLLSEKETQGTSINEDVQTFSMEELASQFIEGVDQIKDNPEKFGATKNDSGAMVFKPDPLLSSVTAEIYVEFLTSVLENIGSSITKNDNKYAPNSKFMNSYKKITDSAVSSGELLLPSPLTMFYLATLAVVFITGANIYKDYKKERRKAERQKLVNKIDETKPTEIQVENTQEIRAHISQELNRGKFKIDEGFYQFDIQGNYIPKNKRHIKPSMFTESLINEGLKSEQIKERIKIQIKNEQANK